MNPPAGSLWRIDVGSLLPGEAVIVRDSPRGGRHREVTESTVALVLPRDDADWFFVRLLVDGRVCWSSNAQWESAVTAGVLRPIHDDD